MATEKMLLYLIKRYEEKNRADKSIGVPKKRKLKRPDSHAVKRLKF